MCGSAARSGQRPQLNNHHEPSNTTQRPSLQSTTCSSVESSVDSLFVLWPNRNRMNRAVGTDTSSNKCHTSSNRCLTSSNKKLRRTLACRLVASSPRFVSSRPSRDVASDFGRDLENLTGRAREARESNCVSFLLYVEHSFFNSHTVTSHILILLSCALCQRLQVS